MSSFGIGRRKSSHRSKKSKPAGKLTIDTQFASQGRTYPYESRVQELSFVSFEESKARKNAFSGKKNLKQQLGDLLPVHGGPRQGVPVIGNNIHPPRSASGDIVAPASEPSQSAPHKRIQGLRPSRLDLTQDVSPSDQAITIGIALPSSTVSQHTWSPESPTQDHDFERKPHYGHDVATPMIVITPARDNFSPSDLAPRRPASSVYSRYTNCFPKHDSNEKAPPVPPLPLFTSTNFPKSKWSMSTAPPRESGLTTFEEDLPTARMRETKLLGDSDAPTRSLSKASSAGLPTPRRSRGWWNVITSPFSAKSTGSHFWKSPPLLSDQAEMGLSDPHAGLIFTSRAPDDDALRSAPASGPSEMADDEPPSLKRSDTAPAALDPNLSTVNIYRVPSTGAAAAYYDSNKHFPSLYLRSKAMGDRDLEGWSPSQSVFVPDRHSKQHTRSVALNMANQGEHNREMDSADSTREGPASERAKDVPIGATVFSSPSPDELDSADLSRPTPARGVTLDSTLSPLSATPTVEDAHIARFVRPHSSNGEQKQVEVSPAPTPSHYGLSFATLGAATISHSEGDRSIPPVSEKPFPTAGHARQDSYGLGISDSERELFPPPKPLSEKPRLGTDRFGQLTIRSLDDDAPSKPWFRRFFWLLATGLAALLMLLIVCLVIFVPQEHTDISVDASWVNLTGFPPLPAGILTVVEPGNTESRDSCVSPESLWSCAAPDGSNPNFRFEVRFRNGTLPGNETEQTSGTKKTKRWQDASPLHRFVRRSSWSEYLFSPSPSPPTTSDQEFLGQTTDNVSVPYNGEATPFYMSLLSAVQLTQKHKRESGNFSYPYPTTNNNDDNSNEQVSTKSANNIPSPATQSNGQPIPPQLYPYTTAQPLRLFDRGKPSEHYAFYNYFDRTIYMSNSSTAANSNNTVTGNVGLANATAVCTFSQTRLLVQIWTKRGGVNSSTSSSSSSSSLNNTAGGEDVAAVNSTANDFTAPGSFPYPVTVTLDRHGGIAKEKGVYCYELDAEQKIVGDAKWWVDELRSAGGTIVNPADVPGSNGTTAATSKRDENMGGIDGGSGGCNCKWQNWS